MFPDLLQGQSLLLERMDGFDALHHVGRIQLIARFCGLWRVHLGHLPLS